MEYTDGQWIMRGVSADDPYCVHTPEELIARVEEIGFLPLFRSGVPGFSVEECTQPQHWWSGNADCDPWEWRAVLARSKRVAYGKFFDKKAGFISLEWLPHFLNYRRDGYDFDARWDDEKASIRAKRLMDCFAGGEEHFSFELKELALFGKGGFPNFEGSVTELQMQCYLTVSDFRQRRNKHGEPYGWSIAVYDTPEALWGERIADYADRCSPEESFAAILAQGEKYFPGTEAAMRKCLR